MSRNTINVRVDDELKRELRELSYDYRVEHSELVRKILTEGARWWRDNFEAKRKDGDQVTKGNPAWERFERDVQSVLGLRSVPGSGNQWHDIGDGVSLPNDPYKLLVDCKMTIRKSYSIDGEMLQRWCDKAVELGYHFALPIRLDGIGEVGGREWVVLSLYDYAELVDCARILNGSKRCSALPMVTGKRNIMKPGTLGCCRRMNHSGSHDNGEIEW